MNSIEKTLKNLEFFYIGFPFPRFSPDKSNFSTHFDEVMRVCLTIVFFQFHSGVLEVGDQGHRRGVARSLKPP